MQLQLHKYDIFYGLICPTYQSIGQLEEWPLCTFIIDFEETIVGILSYKAECSSAYLENERVNGRTKNGIIE